MLSLMYYVFIFPLESFMKLVLELFYHITGSYGISIILLSIVVNILLLPLYYLAQKWKAKDQNLQQKMHQEIKNIKKYYKGQERHFYIQTIYKRHGYHPLSSVKASLGFLIQIPFFFAAFHLLSNYAPLNEIAFGVFQDLSKPDRLIDGINVLPIVMTVMNLLSAYFYMEFLSRAEKIQLWSLAFVFLIALYNEGSGLLLYWTMNNIFSLFKNVVEKKLKLGPLFSQKLKPKIAKPQIYARLIDLLKESHSYFNISIWLFAIIAYVGFDKFSFYSHNSNSTIGVLSIYQSMGIFIFLNIVLLLDYIANEENKNWTFKILVWLFVIVFSIFFVDLLSGVFEFATVYFIRENIMTVLLAFFAVLSANKILKKIMILKDFKPSFQLFLLVYFALFFLTFITNPIMLYNSAMDDFSLSSGVLLTRMFLVFAGGIAIISFLYFVSSKILRNFFIFIGSSLLFSSLLYSFVIQKNYGLLDHFIFHTPEALFVSKAETFLEVIALIVFFYFVTWVLFRYSQVFKKIYIAILFMLGSFFVFNIPHEPNKKTESIEKVNVDAKSFDLTNEQEKTFSFSKEKNVIVIFLDGFSGGEMQKIVDKENLLFKDYTGFVWYKNTLSTGTHTASSIAAMFGGHQYTIEKINARMNKQKGKTLRDELNKAYDVFPKAFISQGWQLSYLYPQYVTALDKRIHNSLFDHGAYYLSKYGTNSKKELEQAKINTELRLLSIVSLFRMSPLFAKEAIYDKGTWNGFYSAESTAADNIYFKADHWGFLTSLVEFFNVDSDEKTLKYFQLGIPHTPTAIALDGTLSIHKSSYYIEAYKSLEKIGELIAKLKEQKIYDQTKIILVADHGWWRPRTNPNFDSNFSEIIPPGLDNRMNTWMVNPLLMVKDFNQTNEFRVSNRFMSNADVPVLVCSALESGCGITDVDPTKHNLRRNLIITTDPKPGSWNSKQYDISEQYEVKENIFNPSNWRRLK